MQSMKTGQKWFTAAAVVAGLTIGSAVQAAPILSVDFQPSPDATATPPGITQTGFVPFDAAGANPSASYSVAEVASGEITISLVATSAGAATPAKSRSDQGSYVANLGDSETFTYGNLFIDLYSDFSNVTDTATNSRIANLTLSGLDANTQYDVQIWSIDVRWNSDGVYKWWDLTHYDAEDPNSDSVLLGAINNKVTPTSAELTSNDAFSIIVRLTSNADGELIFSQTAPGGGGGSLNGLTISLIPEPASLGLLGLSGLILCHRRRRG